MKKELLLQKLENGAFDDRFSALYGASGEMVARQRTRYADAVRRFEELFPQRDDIRLFSAPGRSEIGGNHTDHQRGCALGAAISMDKIAVVSFHDEGVIRFASVGHDTHQVELSDLAIHPEETDSSISLIRGIAARFIRRGVRIRGFDAFSVSDVLSGSGLSSSAAFEVLLGAIIDIGCNGGATDPVEIAKIGQYAENIYYGKKSGLLDQTVCSVGGFVFADFLNGDDPAVSRCRFDFDKAGYRLCITHTRGSHADLTDEYAAVPTEMKSVARQFGKDVLREVDEQEFYHSIPRLRAVCSDRAILRAAHFFGENKRAALEADALRRGDIDEFFRLYRASSLSSATLLQNLYATKTPHQQGIPMGLMMSRRILGEDAAVRVHGGGFAGTVQAFVPIELADEYIRGMDALFGAGSCCVLRARPVGGIEITES